MSQKLIMRHIGYRFYRIFRCNIIGKWTVSRFLLFLFHITLICVIFFVNVKIPIIIRILAGKRRTFESSVL